MLKLILILSLILLQNSFAQVKKDLDGDGITDYVDFDSKSNRIVCRLSSKNLKRIYSKPIEATIMTGVQPTKTGFEFYMGYMRSEWAAQFRYDTNSQKIRLIGISSNNYGPANHDGSGYSSVNLLTNEYIGVSHYFNHRKDILIELPKIKVKIFTPRIYLENFSEAQVDKIWERCWKLDNRETEKIYMGQFKKYLMYYLINREAKDLEISHYLFSIALVFDSVNKSIGVPVPGTGSKSGEE